MLAISDSSFYSETKNSETFLNERNAKITKQSHAYKGYARFYNVEISNSFNPELQLKVTENAIKIEITNWFSELKDFKFE